MNCKSCNNALINIVSYCPQCGAKVVDDRLSLGSLFSQFFSHLFNWDNHFYRTIRDLTVRPHKVLNSYVNGVRKVYFNPLSLFSIYVAFFIFIGQFIPEMKDPTFIEVTVEGDDHRGVQEEVTSQLGSDNVVVNFIKFYRQNINLFILISIPLWAALFKIVFRERNHNYAEHIVFSLYIIPFTGILPLCLAPLAIFDIISLEVINSINTIILLLYINYAFAKLYKLNFKEIVGKNIFGLVVFFVFAFILFFIFILVIKN